jgi:hypothetical protein
MYGISNSQGRIVNTGFSVTACKRIDFMEYDFCNT